MRDGVFQKTECRTLHTRRLCTLRHKGTGATEGTATGTEAIARWPPWNYSYEGYRKKSCLVTQYRSGHRSIQHYQQCQLHQTPSINMFIIIVIIAIIP